MPIAIFTDIDGTLINSDRRVTPETQKALQTCVENGAILTLCSSRCAAGLVPILKEYDLSACMIALGGALIIDEQGQILHNQGMPLQRAAQLIRFVEEKGYDMEPLHCRPLVCPQRQRSPNIARGICFTGNPRAGDARHAGTRYANQ